jgi:hypothetical protein
VAHNKPLAHSFVLIGIDPKNEQAGPVVLDYYPPDIQDKPYDYMYIHSLPSLCSWEVTPCSVEYILTEASGDKKYLIAFSYEKNKAMVLVSEHPIFRTQK